MGILELHFHESEFKFAPSITNKSGEEPELETQESDESAETDTISLDSSRKPSASSSGGSKTARGLGVLIGLAFLVGIGALAKKKIGGMRMDEDDADELDSEMVEESIEIAD